MVKAYIFRCSSFFLLKPSLGGIPVGGGATDSLFYNSPAPPEREREREREKPYKIGVGLDYPTGLLTHTQKTNKGEKFACI